jgi:predicted AAA+ superfamily ATPase
MKNKDNGEAYLCLGAALFLGFIFALLLGMDAYYSRQPAIPLTKEKMEAKDALQRQKAEEAKFRLMVLDLEREQEAEEYKAQRMILEGK